jgi:hypothetical protein
MDPSGRQAEVDGGVGHAVHPTMTGASDVPERDVVESRAWGPGPRGTDGPIGADAWPLAVRAPGRTIRQRDPQRG